jgi:hypothetical protein
LDCFSVYELVVALEHPKLPRKYHIKRFLAMKVPTFRMDNLAISETDQSFIFPASHMHAARASADTYELNYVMKTGIGYCAAESSGLRFVVSH